MILSLKTPLVLRVLVSLNQWSAEENRLCSSILDEHVTNLQCSATMMVALGIVLVFLILVSYILGIVGLTMIYAGKEILQEEKEEAAC